MAQGKSRLMEASKIALLQYTADHKQKAHNYNQKTIFWDREHVYNENLMLRNKIKELEGNNTKAQTRLRRSEKEIVQLSSSKKSKSRDLSVFRSNSSTNFRADSPCTMLKWRVESLREQQHNKKLLLLRKKIRQQKEQNEKLHSQNSDLRKTIKYTRMSELQEQNKQLQEELVRLKRIISQHAKVKEEMLKVFAHQKYQFRLGLRKQVEAKNKLTKELKRALQEIEEMSKVFVDRNTSKKWLATIRNLEEENDKLKKSMQGTTTSQIFNPSINNQEDYTKLEYSQSAISQIPHRTLEKTPQAPAHTRQGELTSLEMLTAKNTTVQFITPIKPSQQKILQPSSQPLFSDKNPSTTIEEIPLSQSKQVPQSKRQTAIRPQLKQDVEQQYSNEEYEDLMQQQL